MIEERKDVIIDKEKFVFIPIGGATGVGMNCFAYGYKGKWLIVDLGVGFPGDGLPGVDVLLPDVSFLEKNKKDILGLVITHAHEDHLGAVGHLWRSLQCPIYVTAFAAELLESKLVENSLLGRAEVNVCELGSLIDLKPFEVEFVSMSHSIPESNALCIRTDKGTVLHTGDWKLLPDTVLNQKTNEKRLKEIGKEGVLALVCDSTNVFSGENKLTETDVRKELEKLIAKYEGKQIAVACFASNVSRVKSIYYAAKKNNRQVCLMGRSLWRMDAAARACGYFEDVPEFLSESEALEQPKGSVLFICTGSQGEPRSALSNLSMLTPQKNAIFFAPEDVVIFSSRIIPGNEKAIALLQKRFKTKDVEIITNKDADIHVSGHFSGKDLQQMYKWIKPKIALPVHGEARELNEHVSLALKWGAKYAFALEDGEVLELGEKPLVLGEVESGILAVDGKKILSLGAEVIRKRRKMIEDGTLVVTLVMDNEGHILGKPKISSFGLIEAGTEDEERLKKEIVEEVSQLEEDITRDDMAENAVRTAVRRFLKEFYGKKPLIEVHLVRV